LLSPPNSGELSGNCGNTGEFWKDDGELWKDDGEFWNDDGEFWEDGMGAAGGFEEVGALPVILIYSR
jgi:hypothetical protein